MRFFINFREFQCITMFFILCLLSANTVHSEQNSIDHTISKDVFSNGSISGWSANYETFDTIGQSSAIGKSSSSNYDNHAGYWPQKRDTPQCMEDDSGSIDISGANVTPGSSVTIQIEIQSAPNDVEAIGFDIAVPDGLIFMSFSKGAILPSNFILDVNMLSEKILRCGAYRGGGTEIISAGASGEIVHLTFQAADAFADQTISWIALKDDISSWTSSPGCLTKGGDCDGDINHDNDITPQDALCAFEKYMLMCPTSNGLECNSFCADVNKDGNDSPADALCIFRKYLNQPSCLD